MKKTIQIYRTDGGGACYDNHRCNLLYEILNYNYTYLFYKLEKIIDHEGCLNVYWTSCPSIIDKQDILSIWMILGEEQINHYIISYEEI